jgi:CheY-like chemotaxis protein
MSMSGMTSQPAVDSTVLLLMDARAGDNGLCAALKRATPNVRCCIARSREEISTHAVPHVMVLDLDIVGDGAFELLRWARTQPHYKQIPVIVLTSSHARADVDRAYDLGANSCLLKPQESSLFDGIARGLGTYASLLNNSSLTATA